jgi:hypothetical protein
MNIIVEIISLIISLLLWTILSKNKEEQDEVKKQDGISVYIEKIDEFYYAWHDKTFIFQTKDTKELVAYIKSKFPNNIIKITSDKELTWLQEAKKELNLN